MEGNRHNFSMYLHGAVLILSAVLSTFGVVGYLRYGDSTEQMLNKNIPTSTTVGLAINIFLCLGVLLTFPLQMYPVIELAELFVFRPKKTEPDKDGKTNEKKNGSMSRVTDAVHVATYLHNEVPTWKRNLLRLIIVLLAAGIAVLTRDFFAYFTAFIGAVGSSVLAYILPCLFHLKLRWHELSLGIKVKDVVIVVFGVLASVVSLYTTISEVVSKV
ncbi:uncharacterized protein LOC131954738 [Physella acuta]|uniref:uncharacterized protein LOC131954738 n=1 Tax=Physella acuta TaxID=109671 RepID=UPI0027DCB063|nr:uncharacterized protein LOC131954738 [Physella acuta]